MKRDQKIRAIALRRQGLSYKEILQQIPVAKSTLSLWFRAVALSAAQKQALTQKKLDAARRGAESKRQQRIRSTKKLKSEARHQIGLLSAREKLLVGAALYWAEGTKQRSSSISSGVSLTNSDPALLKFFKQWLLEVVRINPTDLKYEIYLHETHRHRLLEVRRYWARTLAGEIGEFSTVYYKRNRLKRIRKNQETGYYGLVRMDVRSSSILNRTISGWIESIAE